MARPIGPLFGKRYQLKQRIGIGAFAEVWQAVDALTDKEVAIKIFAPDKGIDADGIELFKKEYLTAFELNHPHLLRTFHFDVTDHGSPYLVMPFCQQGSLMRKLTAGEEFNERDLAIIAMQMADAIMYLNGKNFYHRDVKPDNILILSKDHYVLSDFGISTGIRRTLERTVGYNNDKFFSGSFTAPEYFDGGGTHPKSDIFSLGVSLYELALGRLPYAEMAQAVKNDYVLPDLPTEKYTLAFNAFIKNCLKLNPDKRPDASALYNWSKFYLNNGYWDIEDMKTAELPKFEDSEEPDDYEPLSPPLNYDHFPPEPRPNFKNLTYYILASMIAVSAVALLAYGGYYLYGNLKPQTNPIPIPAYQQLYVKNTIAAETLNRYIQKHAEDTYEDKSNGTQYSMKDLRLQATTDANGNYTDFGILSFGIRPVQYYLLCLLRHETNSEQNHLLMLALPKENQAAKSVKAELNQICPFCTDLQLVPPNEKIIAVNQNGKKYTFLPTDTAALINAPNQKIIFYKNNNTIQTWKWKP